MIFEGGCTVAGRQRRMGSSRETGWQRKNTRKVLWWFLTAAIMGGVIFGCVRGSKQGNAVKNEAEKEGEESRSTLGVWDDQGVKDVEDQDVGAGRFRDKSGIVEGASGLLLRDRGSEEEEVEGVSYVSTDEVEVLVSLKDDAEKNETSRVHGTRSRRGRDPLDEVGGPGLWMGRRRGHAPLRASMEVEDFLLEKYRCRGCQHLQWRAGRPFGYVMNGAAVGLGPDSEGVGIFQMAGREVGGRLPANARPEIHPLVESVKGEAGASTTSGRMLRRVGRMFRRIR